MCNPKINSGHAIGLAAVAQIDKRPVLQPACNRVVTLEAGHPLNKAPQKSISLTTFFTNTDASSALNANETRLVASWSNLKFSQQASPNDPNGLNSSSEKPTISKSSTKSTPVVRKKTKKSSSIESSLFSSCERAPGSISAAQRKQASLVQAQRKMRIAHYGWTTSKLEAKLIHPVVSSSHARRGEKTCSFITSYSDPLYVAYHDEEWGVPVHDDKMLFELLVLCGAQVGLDWATILRKRNEFREAFAEFDAEVVSKFTEREITSISTKYGLDLGRIRGTVDNANQILEVRKEHMQEMRMESDGVEELHVARGQRTCGLADNCLCVCLCVSVRGFSLWPCEHDTPHSSPLSCGECCVGDQPLSFAVSHLGLLRVDACSPLLLPLVLCWCLLGGRV